METRSKKSSSSSPLSIGQQRSDGKKDKTPQPPAVTQDLSVLKTTSTRMELSIAQYMSKDSAADARSFKRSTMANPELLGLLNRPAPPQTPKPERSGE